ncbi:MAG: transposase [Bacteroidota bacterium]
MKNHFHFMVHTKEDFDTNNFGNGLRVMLRSYARAINIQEGRTGSLFQQHTKIKSLEGEGTRSEGNYPLTCFHYIHQNPLKARLVRKMDDYEMSSFNDYLRPSRESICNRELARTLLDLPPSIEEFRKGSYRMVEFPIEW